MQSAIGEEPSAGSCEGSDVLRRVLVQIADLDPPTFLQIEGRTERVVENRGVPSDETGEEVAPTWQGG